MNTVIIAIIVVGSIGLFIGIFLSLASVKFKVEVNEDEEKIGWFDTWNSNDNYYIRWNERNGSR